MQARILSLGVMNRCWRISCWALLALAPLTLAAQELTLHVDVKLVNVFVNVIDQNGAIVAGLTRDDFALTEDGRPQQISVFERQSTPAAACAKTWPRRRMRPGDLPMPCCALRTK
jgi:hypothetical protein